MGIRRRGAQKGLNSKVRLAVNAHGMPVRIIITEGTRAGCSLVPAPIEGIMVELLYADKGYDSNEIIDYAGEMGIEIVLSPKKKQT